GGPWRVFGSARRSPPTWFPSSTLDNFLAFDATNYSETMQILSPFATEITHVFWVALQVRDNEEENIDSNKTMLQNVLNVLVKTSPNSSLKHVCLQTGSKHYMGPIFQRGSYVPHDPPFQENMERLPYPNFYYALEDTLFSFCQSSITYSIHRPSRIIGASSRSFYSMLTTMSVYATICKFEGLPFRFPGNKYTWEHFFDMSDARFIAEQQIWAAGTEEAKNQAFNCTNEDVCSWKIVWKVLCEAHEVEFVPFDEGQEFDWLGEMKKTKFDEVTCLDAADIVLHFENQYVSSMNKSREFGFLGYVDSLKSLGFWIDRLKKMKIIP
ncbi:hypothetical protein Leryth_027157, partial [Lithospermum erythrorhizon]